MKKFEIDHHTLTLINPQPNIYIPFTEEILDLNHSLEIAYKLECEDHFVRDNKYSFDEYLKKIENSSDFNKDIEEFKIDEDENNLYRFLYDNDLLEKYFQMFLDSLPIPIVQIDTIYSSMSCGGVNEEVYSSFILDEDYKISKLSKEEILVNILERLSEN